ncbi:uncharacterized protein RJT21DRAFT_141845 [Scheffersomyces amazonensis]|uniref:uncharacterized protein n=1 Tax=Scheffersomyces amazonensis TaxID=1078765 RepID=UPI00315D57DF
MSSIPLADNQYKTLIEQLVIQPFEIVQYVLEHLTTNYFTEFFVSYGPIPTRVLLGRNFIKHVFIQVKSVDKIEILCSSIFGRKYVMFFDPHITLKFLQLEWIRPVTVMVLFLGTIRNSIDFLDIYMKTLLKINCVEVLIPSVGKGGRKFIAVHRLRIFKDKQGRNRVGQLIDSPHTAGFINYLLFKQLDFQVISSWTALYWLIDKSASSEDLRLPFKDKVPRIHRDLNDRNLSSEGLSSIQISQKLESLNVSRNKIDTINVVRLNRNLLGLYLNDNPLSKIKINHQSDWPSLLTCLNLSNNQLQEEDIAKIQWPKSILYLNLDNSQITSLKTLKSLPDCLRALSLNSCPIETIYNYDESDPNYPSYKLPSELTHLDLDIIGICPQVYSNNGLKVELPSKLEKMTIIAPQWKSLHWIKFPSTLLTLRLFDVELDTSSTSFASEVISDLSNVQDLYFFVPKDYLCTQFVLHEGERLVDIHYNSQNRNRPLRGSRLTGPLFRAAKSINSFSILRLFHYLGEWYELRFYGDGNAGNPSSPSLYAGYFELLFKYEKKNFRDIITIN